VERHHDQLIDTPGHPDFIDEVEGLIGRADGGGWLLVVSAVEGVAGADPRPLCDPAPPGPSDMIFAHKIDRAGGAGRRGVREEIAAGSAPDHHDG